MKGIAKEVKITLNWDRKIEARKREREAWETVVVAVAWIGDKEDNGIVTMERLRKPTVTAPTMDTTIVFANVDELEKILDIDNFFKADKKNAQAVFEGPSWEREDGKIPTIFPPGECEDAWKCPQEYTQSRVLQMFAGFHDLLDIGGSKGTLKMWFGFLNARQYFDFIETQLSKSIGLDVDGEYDHMAVADAEKQTPTEPSSAQQDTPDIPGKKRKPKENDDAPRKRLRMMPTEPKKTTKLGYRVNSYFLSTYVNWEVLIGHIWRLHDVGMIDLIHEPKEGEDEKDTDIVMRALLNFPPRPPTLQPKRKAQDEVVENGSNPSKKFKPEPKPEPKPQFNPRKIRGPKPEVDHAMLREFDHCFEFEFQPFGPGHSNFASFSVSRGPEMHIFKAGGLGTTMKKRKLETPKKDAQKNVEERPAKRCRIEV